MELLIHLDRGKGRLAQQLERGLRERIQAGILRPDTPLPSSRTLADHLRVSRGMVLGVYHQLTAEGYLTARRGAGTWVTPRAAGRRPAPRPEKPPAPRPPAVAFNFRPGSPDVRLFPRKAWLRSMRIALDRDPSLLDYPGYAGLAVTREAMAGYLNRSRALVTDPDRIVMCAGFTQGARIVAEVLRARGARRIAVEDPGYTTWMDVLAGTGLRTVPIPVDDDGLRVTRLARAKVDAVLVTPAHQYPTGVVLSAARRAELLDWAAGSGAIIVEDDYDAEYRYDRDPVGALQGLAPESVAYIGTATKMLAPGLRLGWMALPAALVPAAIQAKRRADFGSPVPEQLALAEFIARGELDRHLRRTRPIYRRRRDALVAALHDAFVSVPIGGVEAGLHLVLPLARSGSESAVVDACAARGARVLGVAQHYAKPDRAPAGLVLGFAAIRVEEMPAAVAQLAAAVAAAR